MVQYVSASSRVGHSSELIGLILESLSAGMGNCNQAKSFLGDACLVDRLWLAEGQRILWKNLDYQEAGRNPFDNVLRRYRDISGFLRQRPDIARAVTQLNIEFPLHDRPIDSEDRNRIEQDFCQILPNLRTLQFGSQAPHLHQIDPPKQSSITRLGLSAANNSTVRTWLDSLPLRELVIHGHVPKGEMDTLRRTSLTVLRIAFINPLVRESFAAQWTSLRWLLQACSSTLQVLEVDGSIHSVYLACEHLRFPALRELQVGGRGALSGVDDVRQIDRLPRASHRLAIPVPHSMWEPEEVVAVASYVKRHGTLTRLEIGVASKAVRDAALFWLLVRPECQERQISFSLTFGTDTMPTDERGIRLMALQSLVPFGAAVLAGFDMDDMADDALPTLQVLADLDTIHDT